MRIACVLAALFTTLSAAHDALASREFIDDAGRKVVLPDRVERVYAAGQQLGIAMVVLLLGLALYNDISRQFG